jgi:hypothetical protein
MGGTSGQKVQSRKGIRGVTAALAVVAIAVAIVMIVSSSIAINSARPGGVRSGAAGQPSTATPCGTLVNVTFPSGFPTAVFWGCTLNATDWRGIQLPGSGWASRIWSVHCSSECNFQVQLAQRPISSAYVGSFYSLWLTYNSTLSSGWGIVGSVPEVATGPQLVAPAYNSPYWTGNGTALSSGTFTVYEPVGVTAYLAVRDGLFGLMGHLLDGPCGVSTSVLLLSGCSVPGITVAANFSPGAVGVVFTEAR